MSLSSLDAGASPEVVRAAYERLNFPSGAPVPSSQECTYVLKGGEQHDMVVVVFQPALLICGQVPSGTPGPLAWPLGCRFQKGEGEGLPRSHAIESKAWHPHVTPTPSPSWASPVANLKSALQQLGLSYVELAAVLGVTRQTIYQWMKDPNVDIRDTHADRLRVLSKLGDAWAELAGARPIPRWCFGNEPIAGKVLVEHLADAVMRGADIGNVLAQVAASTRVRPAPAVLDDIPMPPSDLQLMMQSLVHLTKGED